MTRTEMAYYAVEGWDGKFRDVYGSAMQVCMCGVDDPVEVEVTEDEEGEYVGWLGTGEDSFSMVFDHMTLLRICFPYGIDAAVEAGQGRVVKLRIERKT